MASELKYGPVTLPLREDLSERDKLFVPEWDPAITADAKLEESLAIGAAMDLPVLMVGPTGCGKTKTLQNLAAALNQPLRRINLHGDVRSADLLGEKTLEPDPKTGESVVVWRDGVIPDAKRNGYWLLLDEMDACPPNILFVLQALLEPGHPLCLTGNSGEQVEQEVEGPGMRIFATANTLGRGDSTGIYAGTNMLNEAFLDRFMVAKVGYLPKKDEVAVLTALKIPTKVATPMVDMANMIREGFTKGETTSTFSTRRLVAWGKLMMRMASGVPDGDVLSASYQLAIGNKLPPEEATFFAGVYQRFMGSKP